MVRAHSWPDRARRTHGTIFWRCQFQSITEASFGFFGILQLAVAIAKCPQSLPIFWPFLYSDGKPFRGWCKTTPLEQFVSAHIGNMVRIIGGHMKRSDSAHRTATGGEADCCRCGATAGWPPFPKDGSL